MAKQLVHIGVAVSTVGGMVPGRSNIINIAAVCGEAYRFNQNVAPAGGTYGESVFWAKHPEEFAALQRGTPVPLADAMTKLRAWLRQFQGTLVACSSSADFWHLMYAFFETGRDCPFGTVPIDTNTVAMLQRQRMRPTSVTDKVVPVEVALARWTLVTGGRMPVFGQKPPVRKRKTMLPTPGEIRATATDLDAAIRQQREWAERLAAARPVRRGARPAAGLGDATAPPQANRAGAAWFQPTTVFNPTTPVAAATWHIDRAMDYPDGDPVDPPEEGF